MEDIIKMVMSIDKKASDIMKHTEESLEVKEKDIKDKIESMRKEIMDKTKNEAKVLCDDIIKEAELEALKIKEKSKQECNTLEAKFLKLREKLEDQLFSRIFG
ncbi:hypothetical protein OXPF_01640 [Oxobacter pfennigii]|uniref:V-type ATP synthase subunit H n=1 Tax=Oxobacter pfennigii TaxID=36849 RepID=A0A0P8Z267_9CLOT|nr:hypothetical protein [Oxobacter pfennigii]KPU46245.1 hypothetical protein OXPF_01640 [Oxobacter pfennigii]